MSPRAAVRLEQFGFQDVYDYVPGKADWLAHGLPKAGKRAGDKRILDLTHNDAPTVQINDSLEIAAERMEESGWDSCVVVNDDRVVLGLLRKDDTEAGGSIEDRMENGPSTFRPSGSIESALEYMDRHDVPSVVVSDSFGHLFGLIPRDAAEQAENES